MPTPGFKLKSDLHVCISNLQESWRPCSHLTERSKMSTGSEWEQWTEEGDTVKPKSASPWRTSTTTRHSSHPSLTPSRCSKTQRPAHWLEDFWRMTSMQVSFIPLCASNRNWIHHVPLGVSLSSSALLLLPFLRCDCKCTVWLVRPDFWIYFPAIA